LEVQRHCGCVHYVTSAYPDRDPALNNRLTAGSWRQDNFLADATLPTIASNQAPGNALIFTGSFPNPRKIGLAAAVWSNGVCSVYCSGNGHIREVSRHLVTQVDSWSDGLQQCMFPAMC
jgi:hypothetical protein